MRSSVLSLVLCAGAAGTVHAAGFALIEQGASGVGTAFAGSAAYAKDASVQFFNAAGLAQLTEPQATVAVHAIDLGLKFTDAGSTLPAAGLGRLPAGATRDDAGDLLLVPSLHAAWPLSERLVAGLSVSVPFGLKTEYEDPWIGRFQGIRSELKTINVNPSLAVRLNERFAIGAGIDYQFADATLTNAVMLGAATEGRARLELSDEAWGWNIGVLFTPSEGTSLGLGYRSRISQRLDGDLLVSTAAGAAVPAASGPTSAGIDMPEQVYASYAQALGTRFTLLADLSWTGWSAVQELAAVNPATGAPRDVLNFGFSDAWRYALGGEWQANESWTLRAGIARDESPVDEAHRSVRLPDDDRTWLSIGARWQAGPRLSLDAGYAHLFVDDTTVALTRPQQNAPASFGSTVRGRYGSRVDIFALQVNWSFP